MVPVPGLLASAVALTGLSESVASGVATPTLKPGIVVMVVVVRPLAALDVVGQA